MNQRFSITPANAATDLRLTDSIHRTLTVIGIFGDKNGWCWPSQSTLAELRGVSRQTINTHTKELVKFGYLNIQPRYNQETGAQNSNMMQIKFDFEPDLTGGVKSNTLQGGTSPEVYTPPQALDLTHNAPVNETIERPTITDCTATPSHPPIADFLNEWKRLFPNKPQPRQTKALKKKWASRLKDDGFEEEWLAALSVASRSKTCQSESWFNEKYFLRSEETWTNCLDDWMAWKDEKEESKTQKAAIQNAPAVVGEF